ncbi:alpha/beta fold hydrolase [Mycolicibacter hiberniae]|uniref:Oxidoreductase n=1 Tax=Mycolicibacter hiberniae TaxID=29314 RepID=A0A7I7WZB7_9MYCO|nr:alpha/beta hydrolase [Mycolicibacter hiberniae]MCV7085465.1 alpha/beta hydrolase [Mycolicibacter hiberniae]ORV71257.1 oxidoreductase [Mycolicibacter hiberniae]BBZ22472.1 oxidoreductase [Mycolicibacter hiberniae]
MPTVDIDAGTIHYDTAGPRDGRPVLFVHGYAMGASLWGPVSQRLVARNLRCIAPTWPLGAHPAALRPGADRTLPGIAAMVDAFMGALGLQDVVLVGNDTGGLVSQLVAVGHPDRLGALVLTSCDAFENFPPPIINPYIVAAKAAVTLRVALQPMRLRAFRHYAYGKLAHRDIDQLVKEWVKPPLRDSAVAEDLRQLTKSLNQQTSLDAAARLPGFAKPVLIAWSADDLFFPAEDGKRLAETLPNARFELIEGARTYSMIDQPDRLADLVAEFATATSGMR